MLKNYYLFSFYFKMLWVHLFNATKNFFLWAVFNFRLPIFPAPIKLQVVPKKLQKISWVGFFDFFYVSTS